MTEQIDRRALVDRHAMTFEDISTRVPLGNGEFAVTCDGTGLQTVGGNIMAHWGWHTFPDVPGGLAPDQVPITGTRARGRLRDALYHKEEEEELFAWMYGNPHRMNLGRLRLLRANGQAVEAGDLAQRSRRLDLWSGMLTCRYEIDGQPVQVESVVHPLRHLFATRLSTQLLAEGRLQVRLDFPYPSLDTSTPWVGSWDAVDQHRTEVVQCETRQVVLRRDLETASYHVALVVAGGRIAPGADEHTWEVIPDAGTPALDICCEYVPETIAPLATIPTFTDTCEASAAHGENFWMTGGAIDLSESSDVRWKELERRIVLSQYVMATMASGSYPPPEVGLLGIDDWSGQFHLEGTVLHLAHYALWGRWSMAEKALAYYRKIMPVARAIARQFDYQGVQWPKMVGPEGRDAGWFGDHILLWKQPHPIFLAELAYRLHPERATLDQWGEIVQETAAWMADFPVEDVEGRFHLQPVMPACEQGVTRDTAYELAYWRWGLDTAQRWRERLGLPREAHWDHVRQHLMPLPEADGAYLHSHEWTDTYTARAWEHPDPIGVVAFTPPVDGVDMESAQRTVRKVWSTWNWERCWGWDFPWMAMAAARMGEPSIAVDALLLESRNNAFDQCGISWGPALPIPGGSCPYIHGNGPLLYAVAMMAAGWDGAPDVNAPGFPQDGSWHVRWEGLHRTL